MKFTIIFTPYWCKFHTIVEFYTLSFSYYPYLCIRNHNRIITERFKNLTEPLKPCISFNRKKDCFMIDQWRVSKKLARHVHFR